MCGGDAVGVDRVLLQPGIGRHVGLGHQVARVVQVDAVPLVAVLAAHAVQVGAGALAAPLEGVVVDELAGHRVVAVAQRLGAERPDHLRVAVVAALAQVDVAAGQLQRGVGLDALHRLGGATSGRTAARSPPGRRWRPPAGSARSSGSCWSRPSRARSRRTGVVLSLMVVSRSGIRRLAAAGTATRTGAAAGHGHPGVPGHHQHAGQVQQAAERRGPRRRDRWP